MSMNTLTSEYGNVTIDDDVYSPIKHLAAMPKNGYTFSRWVGDVDGIDPTSPNITVNFGEKTYKSVIAYFEAIVKYTIDIQPSQNGSATVADDPYSPAAKTLTAVPDSMYLFDYWSGDYITESNKRQNPLRLELSKDMPSPRIMPVFKIDQSYTLVHYANGTTLPVQSTGNTLTYENLGRNLVQGQLQPDNSIQMVQLGNSVTKIGDSCFEGCKALQQIEGVSQLVEIGKSAFKDSGLQTFDFSSFRGAFIPEYAFAGTLLNDNHELEIPSTIRSIGAYAFSKCSWVQSVSAANSLQIIGENAFSDCNSLDVIDFTSFVGRIPQITMTSFPDNNGMQIKLHSIDEAMLAFNDNVWNRYYRYVLPKIATDTKFTAKITDYKKSGIITLTLYPHRQAGSGYIIWGDTQTKNEFGIDGTGAEIKLSHTYTKNGTFTIIVNAALLSIAAPAAQIIACTELASSIEYLPIDAFKGSQISTLNIPKTVTDLKTGSFRNMSNLTINRIYLENGQTFGDSFGVLANGRLVNFFNTSTTVELNLSTASLGITSMSKNVLANLSNLQRLYLPSQFSVVDDTLNAAYGLPKLTSIALPDQTQFQVVNGMLIELSSNSVFLATKSANQIPNYITRLTNNSFSGSSIQSIDIPESVQQIGFRAFSSCCSLTTVNVPGMHRSDISADLEVSGTSWFWNNASSYITSVNGFNDEKYGVNPIQVNCQDGQLYYVGITKSPGYLSSAILKNKTHLLTIANDYTQASQAHSLQYMWKDCLSVQNMLEGLVAESNITVLSNSNATLTNVKSKMEEMVNNLAEDQLFIFHVAGHGNQSGSTDSTKKEYLVLYNDKYLYDYEIWEIMKKAKCRCVMIFSTCHAAGMMPTSAPAPQTLKSMPLQADPIANGDDDEEEEYDPEEWEGDEDDPDEQGKFSGAWADSAIEFFMNEEDPPPNEEEESSDDGNIEPMQTRKMLFKASSGLGAASSPRIMVFAACKRNQVSWEIPGTGGHRMTKSMRNNFIHANSKRRLSYNALFYNFTTKHEDAVTAYDPGYSSPVPSLALIGDVNPDIRAFT